MHTLEKNILMYRCGIFKISKVSVVCCVEGVKKCLIYFLKILIIFFKREAGEGGGGADYITLWTLSILICDPRLF